MPIKMINSNGTTPENQQANPELTISVKEVTVGNKLITDDLHNLLEILPAEIRLAVEQHPLKNTLVEVVLDLGRRPEARFPGKAEYLSEQPVSREDLNHCITRVGHFSGDNRAGIEQTLHRISGIRNRSEIGRAHV